MFQKLKLPIQIHHDKKLLTFSLLVQLCERQVLTQVAESLGISMPTASRFLQLARQWFQDPLFIRSSGKMIPTSRMLELKPLLENALVALQNVFCDISTFDPQKTTDTITIEANDNAFLALLTPVLKKVTLLAPQLHIRVLHRQDDLLGDLRSNRVDFGISGSKIMMKSEYPKEFVSHTLLESDHVYICRHNHPLALKQAQGHCLKSEDLSNYREIMTEIPVENGLGVVPIVEKEAFCCTPFFISSIFLLLESNLIHLIPRETALLLQKYLPLEILSSPQHLPWKPLLIWHQRTGSSPLHVWFRSQIITTCHEVYASFPSKIGTP